MIVKNLHDRVHLGGRAKHLIGPYGFRIQFIEAQDTRNKSNTNIFIISSDRIRT